MKTYYVYIMASQRNGTLYVGSTNNLIRRVYEHKNSMILGFTSKHRVHLLVFYEIFAFINDAAMREKRVKRWHRQWKLNLIEKNNPTWKDLYSDICS